MASQSTSIKFQRMHNRRPTYFALAILVATAGLLSACSSNSTGDPTTSPVTGQVTLDGKPIEGAVVMFRPKTSDGATPAQATTDAEGKFDVHTFLDMGKRTKRGMMPAEYQIEVTKRVHASERTSFGTPPKNVLPKRYASAQTSGLETDVSTDGKNEILLELSSP